MDHDCLSKNRRGKPDSGAPWGLPTQVLLAVLCSPLIGPAAAYCAVLRAREQQRGEAFARGGLEAPRLFSGKLLFLFGI